MAFLISSYTYIPVLKQTYITENHEIPFDYKYHFVHCTMYIPDVYMKKN